MSWKYNSLCEKNRETSSWLNYRHIYEVNTSDNASLTFFPRTYNFPIIHANQKKQTAITVKANRIRNSSSCQRFNPKPKDHSCLPPDMCVEQQSGIIFVLIRRTDNCLDNGPTVYKHSARQSFVMWLARQLPVDVYNMSISGSKTGDGVTMSRATFVTTLSIRRLSIGTVFEIEIRIIRCNLRWRDFGVEAIEVSSWNQEYDTIWQKLIIV